MKKKMGGGKEKVERSRTGEETRTQKSYFDVLGLCCSSEVALVEKILNSLDGVKDVSVIVPSKTVIVVHDSALITPFDIAKALNQARLEANVRVRGEPAYQKKWPSPYVLVCGFLLALSFLKYVYKPLEWLAVLAVVVGGWPILMRGFAAVKNRTLDVNILVIIAVMGTLALKDLCEAGTIVFLFTVAEWLQSRASHKANAVMSSLMSIAPQKATIAETGELVDVEDLKPGTILAVKTGEAIPIDGMVVEGSCEVDEKALTGEAFPVAKHKDSIVWAGTINLNGYISVKTTALSEDCVVAKMAKLVEEAQNKKPRFQKLVDKCAKYYIPAVVLLSLGIALVPAAMRAPNQKQWFHLALVVLVSACPCGLILSTPVATFCALSKAASTGLLIKGGDYIETLAKVKTVAFDKTGTITRGEFVMTGFQSLADGVGDDTLLYWVSSIESKSSHPIAEAVLCYSKTRPLKPKPEIVEDFHNFPGEGVSGRIDGKEIFVGNQKLGQRAGYLGALQTQCCSEDGRTIGYVYSGGDVVGKFGLSDVCRSGAKDAIRDLKAMGIRTAMLTGDSRVAAMHAHAQLDHALDDVHGELLPKDKARIIEAYKKSGPTAMVGDGVNDAPALSIADVGISMGVSGSALATETGHVILMSNDVTRIPKAIRLARRTRIKVVHNIAFSITTKAIILAAAFAGHPIIWLAVLADVLTCLLVIFNSMLLLRGSHEHRERKCSGSSHDHNHVHDHNGTCNKSSNDVTMSCCKDSKCSSYERNISQCCSKKANEVNVHERSSQERKCNKSSHHDNHVRDQEDTRNKSSNERKVSQCCSKKCERVKEIDNCCKEECPIDTISCEQSANNCCGIGQEDPKTKEGKSECLQGERPHIHQENSECIVKCHNVNVLMGKREVASCYQSFRKECCHRHEHGHQLGHSHGSFGTDLEGALKEIVIE